MSVGAVLPRHPRGVDEFKNKSIIMFGKRSRLGLDALSNEDQPRTDHKGWNKSQEFEGLKNMGKATMITVLLMHVVSRWPDGTTSVDATCHSTGVQGIQKSASTQPL